MDEMPGEEKPPEEGDEGRGLWGKKSRSTDGGAGGCADNGSEAGRSGRASGGSERKNADPTTIRDGGHRPPQAPHAPRPPCPNQEAKSQSPTPPAPLPGTLRAQQACIRRTEANERPWKEQKRAHTHYFASAPDLLHTKCRFNEKNADRQVRKS